MNFPIRIARHYFSTNMDKIQQCLLNGESVLGVLDLADLPGSTIVCEIYIEPASNGWRFTIRYSPPYFDVEERSQVYRYLRLAVAAAKVEISRFAAIL